MAAKAKDHWVRRGNSSGTWTDPPDKNTYHTTEGGSIEGAIGAYIKNNSWPTGTIDYRKGLRRFCRHLGNNEPARALRNQPGGVQTNRDGTLQWEIVGNAASILSQYDEADWVAMGADIIGPACNDVGVPWVCTVTMPTYPPPNGERLGQESTRLRGQACDDYKGHLGHCNWDENFHGDPGPLTKKHYRGGTVSAIDLIFEGAGALPAPQPKPPQGLFMHLTPLEEREILDKTREIHSQLHSNRDASSPKGASIRNMLSSLHNKVNILLEHG